MNPTPNLDRRDWLLMGALTVLALALRIPYLNQGIWFDEVMTLVRFVRLPFVEIVTEPFSLNNHLVYSLSANLSIMLFGESTWALRFPALIFGVATIPALYYFARQLGRRDVAALSCLFLAVSYHHVWFSQNARGYTGLALGAVLASIILIKILASQKCDWRWWSAYVLTAVVSSSIHLLGSLVILSHGLACLVVCWPEFRTMTRKRLDFIGSMFIVAGLITILFYSRSIIEFVDALGRMHDPLKNIPDFQLEPNPTYLAHVLRRTISLNQMIPGGLLSLYVVGLVFLAGCLETLRRGRLDASVLLLPVFVTISSVVAMTPFMLPRFFFACAPFMVIIACRGGFKLGHALLPALGRRSLVVIACGVALFSLTTLPAAWKPKQDIDGVDAWLQANLRNDDDLACFFHTSYVLSKYLDYDCPRFKRADELQPLEHPGRRTVVVVSHLADHFNDYDNEVPIYMEREYWLEQRFPATLLGGHIDIYIRDPAKRLNQSD